MPVDWRARRRWCLEFRAVKAVSLDLVEYLLIVLEIAVLNGDGHGVSPLFFWVALQPLLGDESVVFALQKTQTAGEQVCVGQRMVQSVDDVQRAAAQAGALAETNRKLGVEMVEVFGAGRNTKRWAEGWSWVSFSSSTGWPDVDRPAIGFVVERHHHARDAPSPNPDRKVRSALRKRGRCLPRGARPQAVRGRERIAASPTSRFPSRLHRSRRGSPRRHRRPVGRHARAGFGADVDEESGRFARCAGRYIELERQLFVLAERFHEVVFDGG